VYPIYPPIFFCFLNDRNSLGVEIAILAWLWLHFHLLFQLYRRDLNPEPFDCESSLLPTRSERHPSSQVFKVLKITFTNPKCRFYFFRCRHFLWTNRGSGLCANRHNSDCCHKSHTFNLGKNQPTVRFILKYFTFLKTTMYVTF